MKVPFDRDLISDQMGRLGLSERTVISLTGIPNAAFREARLTGEFQGTLTLRHIQALADVLGLSLTHLLAEPDHDHPVSEQTASTDAAHLIPILIDVAKMMGVDHLARSLRWERPRLTAALDAIPAILNGTGLRLHTSNGSVTVTPAAPTDKKLKEALGRIRSLSLGLNATEAKALTAIINGRNVLDRQPSNTTRVAVGALKNMGCIALDDSGAYGITDALRSALPDLDLDQHPNATIT
jgi:hypothetical protein